MRLAAIALVLAVSSPGARAEITVKTTPAPVVLGQGERVTIELRGVPGGGPVGAAVNVGRVESIQGEGDALRLSYRLPGERFPQQLCLLLWRRNRPGALVLRLPLNGHAVVPVETRRYSQVTLTVQGQVFGPKSSGASGQVKIHAVVPPGIESAAVEVVDAKGLTTRKRAEIRRPPYNLLALAVRPDRSDAERPLFAIQAAAAEPVEVPARIAVSDAAGRHRPTELEVTRISPGRWSAMWAPRERPEPGRYAVKVWLPEQPGSVTRRDVEVLPAPQPAEPVVETPPAPAAAPPPKRDLRWLVGVATGLSHNLGDLLSARLGLEGGADYPLWRGRIAGILQLRLGWASQDVPVPGHRPASSSVVLAPISIGAAYRLDLRPVIPYVAAGLVLQIIRTHVEGEQTGERLRTDLAVGGLWQAGAELPLGPGGVFFQAGYQHSRLENEDIEGLAGGVLLEAGYRLAL